MPKRTSNKRPAKTGGLGAMSPVAFAPTTNPPQSRAFYEGTLGLTCVSEDALALVFDLHGVPLRVVNVVSVKGFQPAPFTILGWEVPNIAAAVKDLASRGVEFERYPGMEQDASGIWTSPSRARVAWFKDPEGNVLAVTQY